MSICPSDRKKGNPARCWSYANFLILELCMPALCNIVEIPLYRQTPGLVLARIVIDMPMKLPAFIVLLDPQWLGMKIAMAGACQEFYIRLIFCQVSREVLLQDPNDVSPTVIRQHQFRCLLSRNVNLCSGIPGHLAGFPVGIPIEPADNPVANCAFQGLIVILDKVWHVDSVRSGWGGLRMILFPVNWEVKACNGNTAQDRKWSLSVRRSLMRRKQDPGRAGACSDERQTNPLVGGRGCMRPVTQGRR